MRVELHLKGVELTERLHGFIEKKLKSALGRFKHLVKNVQVRLVDINGPRGGEDVECRIQADLGYAGVLTINETQTDPFLAVARASKRVNHSLSRRVSRVRAKRRGRRYVARAQSSFGSDVAAASVEEVLP